jgi:hypothetical protein
MPSSRSGKGYEPEVVERALALRADGLTLVATAEQLRAEFTSAGHITNDTLASLLRRHATKRTEKPAGLDPRTVNYIHTIVHRAFKDAVRWVDLRATLPTHPTRHTAVRSPTASKPGTTISPLIPR